MNSGKYILSYGEMEHCVPLIVNKVNVHMRYEGLTSTVQYYSIIIVVNEMYPGPRSFLPPPPGYQGLTLPTEQPSTGAENISGTHGK